MKRRTQIPWRAIAIGVSVGASYSLLDSFLDQRGARRNSTLHAVHEVVDVATPLIVGVLAGIAVHGLRLRKELVEATRRRADELTQRLGRLDRDQAVWLVAAATLHRIVTPLHTLGLLCDDMLSDDPHAEWVNQARAQVDRISQEVDSLRALRIQDPLPQRMPPKECIARLQERLAPLAERAGIRLSTQGDSPPLFADTHYVQIILENLVHNGIEALEPGGEVRIEIAHDDHEATIAVRDDGPGIPAQRQQHLFEPLLGSSKNVGLGMGLSVSRAMARAMGGELAYVPSVRGAEFSLKLPLATPTGPVA